MEDIFYPGMPDWLNALNQLAKGQLAPIQVDWNAMPGSIKAILNKPDLTLKVDSRNPVLSGVIGGDMSNVVHDARVLFRTTAANAATTLGVAPNGTGLAASINLYAEDHPANCSVAQVSMIAGDCMRLSSAMVGAGAYLPMKFFTSGVERARFGINGEFLFGTTVSGAPISNRTNGYRIDPTTKAMSIRATSSHEFGVPGSSGSHIQFYTDNGTAFVGAGNIFSSGNTTSYASTSDYRLKSGVYRLINCRESMRNLPPEGWTWPDGSPGEGWLAHKAQEFCPQAVIGVKDAMKEVTRYDAEGNPVVSLEPDYQSMDKTFFIPRMYGAQLEMDAALLAAELAIEQMRALLDAALARIDALEARTA
ncbi:hypothetical protein [Janthinobacterium sp. RT4P48]|uniref:hypothetical protein n=1 Tax=Janthinobacterium sp. RT4P48 TaxID=3424188 RepID=UPI003F235A2C